MYWAFHLFFSQLLWFWLIFFIREHNITVTSHDCNGMSNHWQLNCLLNSLFRLTWEEISKLPLLTLCEGNPPSPVASPHRGPESLKIFPCHNIITFERSIRILWDLPWDLLAFQPSAPGEISCQLCHYPHPSLHMLTQYWGLGTSVVWAE